MTNIIKEISVPCIISKQRARLVRFGSSGMGDCEGGCQICRRGGRAYVLEGTVVKCGDGITIHSGNLVEEKAVK